MSEADRTTRTETATHFTVTIVKPKTEQGGKKPSIRGMVKAAFENGTSFAELVKEITLWHPTSAAARSPKKHIGWYRSEYKDQWIMTGPWAPKAKDEGEDAGESTEELTDARRAELEEIRALEARLNQLKSGARRTTIEAGKITKVEYAEPGRAEAINGVKAELQEKMDALTPLETDAERMAREIDERLSAKDEEEPGIVEDVDAAA